MTHPPPNNTMTAMTAEWRDLACSIPDSGESLAAAAADSVRRQALNFRVGELDLDLSRQTITLPQFTRLIQLAEAQNVLAACLAMQEGAVVNTSENRPARQAQIRDRTTPLAQTSIAGMAQHLARLKALGISDVISIGIGGSDVGPRLAVSALSQNPAKHDNLRVHFISSLDPVHARDILAGGLNPHTTAACIISKSFTTLETLANMRLAQAWFKAAGVDTSQHILAITANPEAAAREGFASDQCIVFDAGIGGRYSLWSAVGFGVMAAIGEAGFCGMLDGGAVIDQHVRDTKTTPDKNAPLALALMRFWNTSILQRPAEAILPYSHRLGLLPFWVQQLEMESNGKPSPLASDAKDLMTAPIVFGSGGSQAQHAFFQHLHQSPLVTPVTMLASRVADDDADQPAQQHRGMLMQILAQADALAIGNPAQGFPGGRPSSIITWPCLTPYVFGQLLAVYEYASIMAGVLWGVNSFDQPGVELGKRMARDYHDYAQAKTQSPPQAMTRASREFIKRLNATGD